ncbi:hypothetical protein EV702DRAFT_555038 [Suillus placidus]|uniref:Uncharacterized protein n=1 Tax=Suillus placidus TaxID=48579 RepID=A0A9P6ZNT4_9AGAM|nr:hypothetical protein EV702DRAFT_555038 [Suillus placidus]
MIVSVRLHFGTILILKSLHGKSATPAVAIPLLRLRCHRAMLCSAYAVHLQRHPTLELELGRRIRNPWHVPLYFLSSLRLPLQVFNLLGFN